MEASHRTASVRAAVLKQLQRRADIAYRSLQVLL